MKLKPVVARPIIRDILEEVQSKPADHAPVTVYWAKKLSEWYEKRRRGVTALAQSEEIRQVARFYRRLSRKERRHGNRPIQTFIIEQGLSVTVEEFFETWFAARVLLDRDSNIVHLCETNLYCCYRIETCPADEFQLIHRFINRNSDVQAVIGQHDDVAPEDLNGANDWMVWLRPVEASSVMAWRLSHPVLIEEDVKDALCFYSDPINYTPTQLNEPKTAVHGDRGRRARDLLARCGVRKTV